MGTVEWGLEVGWSVMAGLEQDKLVRHLLAGSVRRGCARLVLVGLERAGLGLGWVELGSARLG